MSLVGQIADQLRPAVAFGLGQFRVGHVDARAGQPWKAGRQRVLLGSARPFCGGQLANIALRTASRSTPRISLASFAERLGVGLDVDGAMAMERATRPSSTPSRAKRIRSRRRPPSACRDRSGRRCKRWPRRRRRAGLRHSPHVVQVVVLGRIVGHGEMDQRQHAGLKVDRAEHVAGTALRDADLRAEVAVGTKERRLRG